MGPVLTLRDQFWDQFSDQGEKRDMKKKFGTVVPTSTRTVRGKNVPGDRAKFRARYSYGGRKHSAPELFVRESHAKAWLEDEAELIRSGRWTAPAERAKKAEQDSTTVSQWLDRYHDFKEAEGIRASTMRTYRNTTKSRIHAYPIGKLRLSELTQADVQGWWDQMQRDYPLGTDGKATGRETNRKGYTRLKAALAEAVHRGLLDANPAEVKAAAKKVKTKDKALPTRSEMESIVHAAPKQYKLAAALCALHGLRVGESLALKPEDVEISGEVPFAPSATVHVRRNVQRVQHEDGHVYMLEQDTKTTAGEREVAVLSEYVSVLQERLAHAVGNGQRFLTETRNGQIVMDTSFRSVWNRAREKAGVREDITPHYGRNWLITKLAEKGATPAEIGTILGQKDMDTILGVYMKVRAARPAELMGLIGADDE